LPLVDSIVGLFLNTLPLAVHLDPRLPLCTWLRSLHQRQSSLPQAELSPLTLVQSFSHIPRGTPLFDSIVVFENYPVDPALLGHAGPLTIDQIQSAEQTNYPLTLVGTPGEMVQLRFLHDPHRIDRG